MDIEPGPMRIVFDLRSPIPEESDTVDYIYHEHFIEHLTRDEGIALFKECFRVLKKGGVMRFSTPDLHMLCIWYQQGKINQWPGTWEPKSNAQFFNEAMRLWGHQFLYDTEELGMILGELGFSHLLMEEYHNSEHDALREIEARPYQRDIIMECTK